MLKWGDFYIKTGFVYSVCIVFAPSINSNRMMAQVYLARVYQYVKL